MNPAERDRAGLDAQAAETIRVYQRRIATRVDRMMALLIAAEWAGAIALALFISPVTWDGSIGRVHPHLLAALLVGPALVIGPAFLALRYPARTATRHTIAVSQMLMSSLLIEVTNGRIETHFHIFGSLAFLALYRDWRVLVVASLVTGLDHMARGFLWPWTIYGALTVSPWRWVEHTWWVAFEDFFLMLSFRQVRREMWIVARREVRLAHGAHHDVLTGLPNRRLLQERFLSSRTREDWPAAVFFLDLDRFKQVNDTLGHAVGDKLLSAVSAALSTLFGPDDTVARVGGDEFVILTRRGDESEIGQIAEKILGIFLEPFEVGEHRLLLSASVGVSLAPDHGNELGALQAAADLAMYDAKSRGRGRWEMYSPRLLARENDRREIEQDLQSALRRGKMDVHYQPLLNGHEQVTGFEALLRWKHPRMGFIAPDKFIPLAEESGLIVELGEWVLRRACLQCVDWQRHGAPIAISVNVSAVQFELPQFVDIVQTVLRETGMSPHTLTLEVTESVLMRNVELARIHLLRLRQMGVTVALDDFGSGYSSLGYLQSLPADAIKLDNRFIERASSGQTRILQSVLELAHENGLRVTAEGIETSAQSRMLLDMGCDFLQGYFYGRPMAAAAATEFLGRHAIAAMEQELAHAS